MHKQVIIAFATAPLVAASLFVAVSALDGGLAREFAEVLVTALVTYIYAGIGTLALALPLFLVASRFNFVRWWTALMAGGAIGFLFSLMISPSAPILRGYFPLTGIGVVSGLFFWFIVRRRQRLTFVGADAP